MVYTNSQEAILAYDSDKNNANSYFNGLNISDFGNSVSNWTLAIDRGSSYDSVAVAINTDGNKQYALFKRNSDQIAQLFDNSNWNNQTINSDISTPINLAISSNSQKYLISTPSNIYQSTDGITFSSVSVPVGFTSFNKVAISADGSTSIAGSLETIILCKNNVWTISNIVVNPIIITDIKSIAISASGNCAVIILILYNTITFGYGSFVYYSSNIKDSSPGWIDITPNISGAILQKVVISADGSKITIIDEMGKIYYNNNITFSSINWITANITGIASGSMFTSVSMSASGKYQVASTSNDGIYYSINSGVDWNKASLPTSTTTKNWKDIKISSDATYIIAITTDEQVWTCKSTLISSPTETIPIETMSAQVQEQTTSAQAQEQTTSTQVQAQEQTTSTQGQEQEQTTPSSDFVIDAATEAIDAANAATDAANLAAEAADAAKDAADAATAAVAELATKVASLIAGIKAQINTLTNLVIKIQKKVKA